MPLFLLQHEKQEAVQKCIPVVQMKNKCLTPHFHFYNKCACLLIMWASHLVKVATNNFSPLALHMVLWMPSLSHRQLDHFRLPQSCKQQHHRTKRIYSITESAIEMDGQLNFLFQGGKKTSYSVSGVDDTDGLNILYPLHCAINVYNIHCSRIQNYCQLHCILKDQFIF